MADEKKDQEKTTEHKVGVYLCYCGGNISDHVEVEKVAAKVKKLPGVATVKTDTFMCSDPGQDLIIEDLKSGAVDRVVVASCAPDLHENTFRSAVVRAGKNPYIYEHANIREQVSWVHHGEKATAKAFSLVAAAKAKAQRLIPLEPIRVEAKKHAVVIGAGVAGLRAAKDMAVRGIGVTLLEKSPFLGGRVAELDHLAPTGEKASDIISELTHEVLNDPGITVHTCARVTNFEGYVGNFKLSFEKQPLEPGSYDDKFKRMGWAGANSDKFIPFVGVCPFVAPEKTEEHTLECGVIVLATGFKPYTPHRNEYGFGEFKEVITLQELIRIMAENKGSHELKVNGKAIKNMAMIHCVGSRQIPGIHEAGDGRVLNEYCSRTCCSAMLQAAGLIRDNHPGTHIFEFYRDIRTYGRGHEELYERASRKKVVFARFEADVAPVVSQNADSDGHPLMVQVKDVLTFGEEIAVPVDLVVLAVGTEPNDVSDLVEMMKLPVGADRFLSEVHPKLRPQELAVTGILLAGTCQAPFDIGEACAAASAAAAKASALLSSDHVELDPFVAEVDLDKCTGTGDCIDTCLSDGALKLVEMEIEGEQVMRAQVTPAMCMGCGACVAVCPENAINVLGWTLEQYEAMVDMIVSDEIAAL